MTAIAAGGAQACALTEGGGVKCWGRIGGRTPVDVPGLSAGVAAVATAGGHACALTTAGGVKCWGSNLNGQLGDGTTTDRSEAVDVLGLGGGVAEIAAGFMHTCARTTAGAVKCRGDNTWGQVGDGTTVDRPTPVDVVGLSGGVQAVGSGFNHTCALTSLGGAKCWGFNFNGQLGDGTTDQRLTPVEPIGFEAPRTITIRKAGTGAGSVRSSPAGIACGARCSEAFSYGSSVVLTASPRPGSVFAGWAGACTGKRPCRLALRDDQVVLARFDRICVVPNVRGKSPAAARRAITRAGCSLGKVTRAASAAPAGRVVSQRPAPGRRLARGGKVHLVVSGGTHA